MYSIFTDDLINTSPLPKKSSLVNFSLFRELYCPVPFRSFSVKYVSDGCEKYTVNGHPYQVKTGQYLLANHFAEGFIEIESKKPVKGICVDIAPDLLSEVVASQRRPDTPFPDIGLDTFFNSPDFFDNLYTGSETRVGHFFKQLDTELSKNPFCQYAFSPEFYYSLAEKIVADHMPLYKQLQSIPVLKSETRKALFRRVTRGKNFIDNSFKSNLEVKMIAMESNLSEYHFYRLFKTVFGISPYQYLIQKRLHYAKSLLHQGLNSVSRVAMESGFSDIHAFSKSFKKYYGISPSAIIG